MSEQEHHPEHSGEAITIMRITPMQQTGVIVTSTVQETSGRLPDAYSGYFDNRSPPLQWPVVSVVWSPKLPLPAAYTRPAGTHGAPGRVDPQVVQLSRCMLNPGWVERFTGWRQPTSPPPRLKPCPAPW